MDEPSSIIIDSKVPGGNPVLSKEQKQKFMKKSLGEEDEESDQAMDSQDKKKAKKGQQNSDKQQL